MSHLPPDTALYARWENVAPETLRAPTPPIMRPTLLHALVALRASTGWGRRHRARGERLP